MCPPPHASYFSKPCDGFFCDSQGMWVMPCMAALEGGAVRALQSGRLQRHKPGALLLCGQALLLVSSKLIHMFHSVPLSNHQLPPAFRCLVSPPPLPPSPPDG
jgi:hypothetical protein